MSRTKSSEVGRGRGAPVGSTNGAAPGYGLDTIRLAAGVDLKSVHTSLIRMFNRMQARDAGAQADRRELRVLIEQLYGSREEILDAAEQVARKAAA